MATLFELKDEISKGRRVRRKAWGLGSYEALGFHSAYPEDIFADDWELEPLPKKKKKVTVYQFIIITLEGEIYSTTGKLYKNETEFNREFPDDKILKTIPHELEVEE